MKPRTPNVIPGFSRQGVVDKFKATVVTPCAGCGFKAQNTGVP